VEMFNSQRFPLYAIYKTDLGDFGLVDFDLVDFDLVDFDLVDFDLVDFDLVDFDSMDQLRIMLSVFFPN